MTSTEVCPACLEETKLATLPCKHMMCLSCIINWGKDKREMTCPLCRDRTAMVGMERACVTFLGREGRPNVVVEIDASGLPGPFATNPETELPRLPSKNLMVSRIYDQLVTAFVFSSQMKRIGDYALLDTPDNYLRYLADKITGRALTECRNMTGFRVCDDDSIRMIFFDSAIVNGAVRYERRAPFVKGTRLLLRPEFNGRKSRYAVEINRTNAKTFSSPWISDEIDWPVDAQYQEERVRVVFDLRDFGALFRS